MFLHCFKSSKEVKQFSIFYSISYTRINSEVSLMKFYVEMTSTSQLIVGFLKINLNKTFFFFYDEHICPVSEFEYRGYSNLSENI